MAVSLPSIGATTGTLTASGVGSGLDVKGLVSQLMAVEQRPLTLLSQKEAGFLSEISSLGSVQGALSSLQSAAQSLATAGTASYTTAVGDSTVLTATADSTAVAGSYSITVNALAQGQKLVSPAITGVASTTAAIGTGSATTLTVTLGTLTGVFTPDPAKTPVTLTIDSTNNTLAGMRDAINAASAGITASIINDGGATPYHLVLTSNSTGAANSIKLATGGAAPDPTIAALLDYDPAAPTPNFAVLQAAQDASFIVDGVTIASASNIVTGAIQGVTLELAKEPGTAVSVAVMRSSTNLVSALNVLVSAYNSANKTIASTTAKGAMLQGDWAVLSLQRQVRSILGSVQTAGGTYTTLSQLGITFQKDGSLALDSSKVSAAVAANIGSVSALAAALGSAVKSAVSAMVGSSGPISSRTDGINRSIKDIGVRRTDIQRRLDATQARYQAQFSALDTLMSSMTKTSTFLSQQLNNLPNYYNNKG